MERCFYDVVTFITEKLRELGPEQIETIVKIFINACLGISLYVFLYYGLCDIIRIIKFKKQKNEDSTKEEA